MDWLGDVELVQQSDHVGCHGRLAEIGVVLGRTPCTTVVGRDAAIALFGQQGQDVAELVRGLGEPVDEEDCCFWGSMA
jgi:hypothetical protein